MNSIQLLRFQVPGTQHAVTPEHLNVTTYVLMCFSNEREVICIASPLLIHILCCTLALLSKSSRQCHNVLLYMLHKPVMNKAIRIQKYI